MVCCAGGVDQDPLLRVFPQEGETVVRRVFRGPPALPAVPGRVGQPLAMAVLIVLAADFIVALGSAPPMIAA